MAGYGRVYAVPDPVGIRRFFSCRYKHLLKINDDCIECCRKLSNAGTKTGNDRMISIPVVFNLSHWRQEWDTQYQYGFWVLFANLLQQITVVVFKGLYINFY